MAMNSSFKNMSLCLMAICFVCSALLAGVYVLTEEPIAQARDKKAADAIAAVAPEFTAMSFPQEATIEVNGKDKAYEYYFLFNDADTVAVVVETSEVGFGGPVKMYVGFTPDGTIYDTSVVDCSNETPGLGAKCTEPAFHDQFAGWNPAQKSLKVRKDGGDVDAITAATITSRAYTLAVANAVEVFKSLNLGGQANE